MTIYTLDSGLRLTHQEFQAWDNSGSRGSYGYALWFSAVAPVLCMPIQGKSDIQGAYLCMLTHLVQYKHVGISGRWTAQCCRKLT